MNDFFLPIITAVVTDGYNDPVSISPQRMKQSGAFITTSESVLFMLMKDAKHPNFKQVQSLVQQSAPDSALLGRL